LTISNDTFRQRIEKVKKVAMEKAIPALWITKTENKFYLSGFESSNFYIFLTKEKDYLLTDFRYIETAEALKDNFTIVLISNQYTPFDFLKENCPDILGIEYKSITFDFYNDMMEKVRPKHVVPADQIIENIRSIKEEAEIDCIRKAASITNMGFLHLLDYVRPGLTEKQIALELEFFMKQEGADALAFDTIVACGERGSLPHAMPTERVVKEGDFITFDFGAKFGGYCSDMTRTIGIGAVSDEQKAVYALVLEAQQSAAASIRSGFPAAEADRIARDLITNAGYGSCFGHGLGHGVGLEIHEAPTLNSVSAEILDKNMIVTVEPGIYIPGKFGVRIEDLAVVEDSGIITLSTVDKELIIL